jgi:Kef-type K+ transport system membrane component KefB/nucleotide-binding universal stress UspA family protein
MRLLSSGRLLVAIALALGLLMLAPGFAIDIAGHGLGQAAGNGASASGNAEAILVADILLLLVVGRLLGEAMQRPRQPALMGQLLAGIVLGPSLLGWIWPEAQKFLFPPDPAQKGMIDGLSQIGILMLLLLTGMETDLRLARRSGFTSVAVALSGLALPFGCGFLLGQFLPAAMLPAMTGGRIVPALFLGTALSISSIKIVAMVVREMNFTRRNLGQIILATAIMEDTVGWVVIAITFGIAGAGRLDLTDLAKTMGGVILFLVFCFTAGRWLVFSAIRWTNDNFRSEFPIITMILVIMGTGALMTHLLGVRTVLGAFMAGVLIGQSPILTDHIQQQLRGLITAFFMPVFFGLSGLAADLTILKDPALALLTIGLVLVASVGKFAGALVGSLIGRLSWREGVALGCAMNARGSTEVIVASIGLSMGALSPNLYTMIVAMAVITTLAMPPMLRAALANLPLHKEEKIRIEREAIDERGFVPRLERLLLAADGTATGRFVARLAGLLAGAHGMPVTIVKLDADLRAPSDDAVPSGGTDAAPEMDAPKALSRPQSADDQRADPVARAVEEGARKSAAKVDESEPEPKKVHLTTRVPVDAPAAVVRDEARKGYDLMFVGLADSIEPDGGFAPKVTRIAAGFDGPLIVLADGEHRGGLSGGSRILLPVNGTPVSRHAAEVAFVLARGTGAWVHVLFVSQTDGLSRTRGREEGVLKDVTELGARYEVPVSTQISARAAAADAILKEGRRNYAMIVMGVSVRHGEELFFGNTAQAVLRGGICPVLCVAS